ncbi:hypothetical protein J6590_029234 [Homalodisca vitripennis]|nr:hypothetical protein J6590_029234 [Homalodisca vitripennis]
MREMRGTVIRPYDSDLPGCGGFPARVRALLGVTRSVLTRITPDPLTPASQTDARVTRHARHAYNSSSPTITHT